MTHSRVETMALKDTFHSKFELLHLFELGHNYQS